MSDEFDNINPLDGMNPFEKLLFMMQLKELKEVLDEIKKDVEANYDVREKKIGDRVKIWDFTANKTKVSGRKINDTETYFRENEAIVVSENENIIFTYNPEEDIELNDFQKEKIKEMELPSLKLDVLLKYPDGTEVYTNSSFIKRTDKYEK